MRVLTKSGVSLLLRCTLNVSVEADAVALGSGERESSHALRMYDNIFDVDIATLQLVSWF